MRQQPLTPEEWTRLATYLRSAEDNMRAAWQLLQSKSTKHDKAFRACLKVCKKVGDARIVECDNRWLCENRNQDASHSPMFGMPRKDPEE